MPYRKPAEMPVEESPKLLYKKPWWKIWTPRETHKYANGDRLIWYWIRSWKTPLRPYKSSFDFMQAQKEVKYLWYTTEGNWVFRGRAEKASSMLSLQTDYATWIMHSDSFEQLKSAVQKIETKNNELYRGFVQLEDLINKENAPPPKVTRI